MAENEEIDEVALDIKRTQKNTAALVSLIANEQRAKSWAKPTPSGFINGGDFLASVRRQVVERQPDPRLVVVENAVTTWAGESVPGAGGFACPSDFVEDVLLPVTGSGSLLSAFDPVPTRSDQLKAAVDETAEWGTDGVTADLAAEGAAVTPTKGVLKPVTCSLHRIPALLHASEELIGRSVGYQRYVWKALGRKIRARVESKIMRGTGVAAQAG